MTDRYYYETVSVGRYHVREKGKGRLLSPLAECTEVQAAEKIVRALNHVYHLDAYIEGTLFVGVDFNEGEKKNGKTV